MQRRGKKEIGSIQIFLNLFLLTGENHLLRVPQRGTFSLHLPQIIAIPHDQYAKLRRPTRIQLLQCIDQVSQSLFLRDPADIDADSCITRKVQFRTQRALFFCTAIRVLGHAVIHKRKHFLLVSSKYITL